MATVLCVLYPDPVDGYPPRYVRDAIPVITHYADGQTAPTPAGPPGFHPGGSSARCPARSACAPTWKRTATR